MSIDHDALSGLATTTGGAGPQRTVLVRPLGSAPTHPTPDHPTRPAASSADEPTAIEEYQHLVEVVDTVTADVEVSEVDRESLVDLALSVSRNVVSAAQSVESRPSRPTPSGPAPWRSTGTGGAAPLPNPLPHVSPSVSPGVVQQVVRNAGTTAWLDFLSRPSVQDAGAELLPEMSSRAMLASQDLLVAALQAHADRSAPSTRALRARVREHLLAGEPADELAARVGLRLAEAYVVVGMDTACEVPARSADGNSGSFVARRGELTLLLLPAPEGAVRGEAKAIADRQLGSSGRTEPESHADVWAVTLAASRSAIPSAVDEVESLMRVARALECPPRSYSAEDLSIEMALLRCPDLSVMLASRLAPLHASGAPLVETLRTYLASSQDRRQASKALHIHPNTLDYRLRRIKELTGLTPTVPRDIQVLGAALTAWQLQHGHED